MYPTHFVQDIFPRPIAR